MFKPLFLFPGWSYDKKVRDMKCAELQELSEKHRFAGSTRRLSRSTGIVTVTSYSIPMGLNKLAGRQRVKWGGAHWRSEADLRRNPSSWKSRISLKKLFAS